jgi:hypothetical protein
MKRSGSSLFGGSLRGNWRLQNERRKGISVRNSGQVDALPVGFARAYAPAIAKKTDSDCGRKRKDADLVYKFSTVSLAMADPAAAVHLGQNVFGKSPGRSG